MYFDNIKSQKQFLILIILILSITSVSAQKVRTEFGTINSQKYSGYSMIIADDIEKVMDFWISELKKNGKIRRKRDFYQIGEFHLPDEYYPEAAFYTRVSDRDSISSKIWIALDPETLLAGENGEDNVNLALENYVSTLENEYERYLIQLQIVDAERAGTFTSRQKQRLIQEGKNLEYQLTESAAEKERLLESIEKLELEILALTQKIVNNKNAVEQSDIDLEKINKMMETYRQNLRKLGN